jgi:hypothetical protein
MSVLIECYNVVVRMEAIERRFPGGLWGYLTACPNQTFACDDHLTRVGFMTIDDVDTFGLRVLARGGMAVQVEGTSRVGFEDEDVALVQQGQGLFLTASPPWLAYEERPDGICHCWLASQPPGELCAPQGWTPPHPGCFKALRAIPPMLRAADCPPPDGVPTMFQGRTYGSKGHKKGLYYLTFANKGD